MTCYTYSSGFSIAQNISGSQFFIWTKVAVLYYILCFPYHHIFPLSDRFLFLEINKSHMVQGQESMEVAACVGFRIWLRNVAQVEMSALMHCDAGFATSLMITFLVACGVLYHENAA